MKLKSLALTITKALGFAILLNAATVSLDSAVLLAKAKVEQKAEPVLEKTLSGRVNPPSKLTPKNATLLQKAGKLGGEDKYEAAIAALEKVLANKKANAYEVSKAQQMKASFLYNSDRVPEAVTAAQAAVAANGLSNLEHLQTMLFVAQLQYQKEDYASAVKSWDAYAAESPVVKGADYATQASSYYNQDNYKETVKYIDKALATGETPVNSWYQLKANSLYQDENYKDAVVFLKEMIVKDPKNKQWVNLAVSSYVSLENFDDALSLLNSAKANGMMDSPEMWKQLYQLHQNAEQYVKAAEVIEEALAAGQLPRDGKIFNALGQNFYTAAQDLDGKPEAKPLLDKAEAAFKEAIKLDPADGTAEVWAAQLNLFERDNSKVARDFLASAVTKKIAQLGNAYYLLGVAEYNVGNNAAAKAALIKAQGYPESKSNATNFLKNVQ